MKKILLIGAMVGMLGFASKANAGVHVSVGIGGPFYGPTPYYYGGYAGPAVYYGPGYYPGYNGYWRGGIIAEAIATMAAATPIIKREKSRFKSETLGGPITRHPTVIAPA